MIDARKEYIDVQTAVLGCMLIEPERVPAMMQEISASDFTDATYRLIFEHIASMFNCGEHIDAVTINEKLGGKYTQLLAQLIDVTPSAAAAPEYARLLKERSRMYQLRGIGDELAEAEDVDAVKALLDKAQLLLVGRQNVRCTDMHSALLSFYERHDSETKPSFVKWSFNKLNDLLRIHERDFVVIGGGPSDGKTTLALTFATEQAKTKKVGFFSFETDQDKLFDRLMAFSAQIELPKIQLNALNERDWTTVHGIEKFVLSENLEIVESSGMSVSDIRAWSLSRHYEVIYIDYLQKVAAPQGMKDVYNDFARVTAVSSQLQNLAKQAGIVVVALSQFARRKGKDGKKLAPPTMSDLRSSGQIEQDADAIMLLFRESEGAEESRRIVNVVKNKDGIANRAVLLDFDGARQSYRQSRSELKLPKPKPKMQMDFSMLPDDTPLPAEFTKKGESS